MRLVGNRTIHIDSSGLCTSVGDRSSASEDESIAMRVVKEEHGTVCEVGTTVAYSRSGTKAPRGSRYLKVMHGL